MGRQRLATANDPSSAFCQVWVSRLGKGPTKTIESKRDIDMLPLVEQALLAQRDANQLRSPWVFANRDGGPLDITNLRERVWRPAIRRAKLRIRTLYQTRHTFATLMLEGGESPGWVAGQLGHANAEMVYRHYHKFIRWPLLVGMGPPTGKLERLGSRRAPVRPGIRRSAGRKEHHVEL